MTFARIVGFGDSWFWGDELLDPQLANNNIHVSDPRNIQYRESNCFLGLLGKHYNVPTNNFGWPGASIRSTIWIYLWWLENCSKDVDDSLVLIGLTNAHRNSFYNPNHLSRDASDPPWNRFVHDQWIKSAPYMFDESWQELSKLNISLTHSEELNRLNYREATWFFHGQSLAQRNITMQINVVNPPCRVELDSLIMGTSSLQNYLRSFPDVWASGHHPNLLGHNLIAKKLIDEINHAILK